MSQQEWYQAFLPEFDTVAFDPLDPAKRYHVGIFIKTEHDGPAGSMFHVTGDVIAASGMRFEEKADYAALQSAHLRRSTKLGWVKREDFESGRIYDLLKALPRPTKQQGINFWEVDPDTGRHEIIWTKQNGERYGPGEERRPVFKCNEWLDQYAIPALREAGILCSSI